MQLIRSFQSRFFKPLQSVVPPRRYLLPIGQWGATGWELIGRIAFAGIMATCLAFSIEGCSSTDDPAGPAGTSNVVVDLQNLQPSLGALSPTFDPGTQTYEVKVGPTIKELTLTATVADPRVTLKINEQVWPSGQPYGPIPVQPGRNPKIPLLVEALGLSKDYAVVVEVATTPDLQNLEAAAGPLVPAFDPDKTAYTVTTDTNTASTTITATLVDDTASLTINGTAAVSGQPSVPIPLPYGQTPIPVSVQTTDGKTKIYTVTVIRPTPDCSTSLANLTVNQGQLSPIFDPNTENYAVAVGSGVGSLTVIAAAHTNATVKINGQVTTSAQVPLNQAGSSTTITITVDCPGQPTKTYTIQVDREAPCDSHLTSLTVNQGQLSPAFNPATQNYTVNVGSTVGSITVTARAATAVSINGQPANSLQVPLEPAGQKTTILVVVQCPDGTSKTYTIVVERDAPCSTNLTNLTLDGGKIPLFFKSDQLDYVVEVESTVSSLTVAATKQDANATVEIDGQSTNSLLVTLGAPGTSKTIQVVVRCADGSKPYRITVTRRKGDPSLANLTVVSYGYIGGGNGCTSSQYKLDFIKTTLNYTVNVEYYISQVCVTQTKANSGQTLTYKVNGVSTSSLSPVTLGAVGSTTTITIEVTASDGVTKQTYTITVNRQPDSNSLLQSLTLPPSGDQYLLRPNAPTYECSSTLPSRFISTVFRYCMYAYHTFDLNAVPQSSTATMTISINGGSKDQLKSGTNYRISIGEGATLLIKIEVTAQDGAKTTYQIDAYGVFG
jgi:hypothetical protein